MFFINIILNAGCRVGGLVKEESWRHVTYIPLVLLRMPATKFLLLFLVQFENFDQSVNLAQL